MNKTYYLFFMKNLLSFLIPMLIPLLILGFSYPLFVEKYIKEELSRNNISLLHQYKENIELIFNELDTLVIDFISDPSNVPRLSAVLNQEEIEDQPILESFSGLIRKSANARPYAHSIYFYADNPNDRFITASGGFENVSTYPDISWFHSYKEHRYTDKVWTELREIKRFDVAKNLYPTKIVSLFRNVVATQYDKSDGVIVLNVLPSYIKNQLYGLRLMDEQSIMILDENQNIIFQNEVFPYSNTLNFELVINSDETLFDITSNKESYTVAKLTSRMYGWTFVSIIPHSSLYQIPSVLLSYTIIGIIISFFIGVIVSFFLTKKNYNDIKNIISVIDSAEANRPLPPIRNDTKDVYSYIIQKIIRKFIEHSYLEVQLSERKYKLKTIELLALQSQLNPHFLFNTLESIYWKVLGLTGKHNDANQMLEYLSGLLKYSLLDPNKSVPLDHEINSTMNYIEILKFRYKDKFEVVWDVDSNLRHFIVPKLLLQPIIENSIHHGIRGKNGQGLIKIKVYRQNDLMIIRTTDNGTGMTKTKLKEVCNRIDQDEEISKHIGLYNTNRRLKLTFDDHYRMVIQSKLNWGTSVTLTIPLP